MLLYIPPKFPSANMVTIKLCHALIESKILFDVEYNIPDKIGMRGARFDVIIIHNGNIVGIIETKRNPTISPRVKKTKQIERYEQYGVPVFLCRGEGLVQEALEFSKKLCT
jgi:hypothetical protein